MRIAFLSDTHGNYIALQAVLADLQTARADQIVFLGDTVTIGSHPNETLDAVRELGCDIFIMGNHDEAVLHPERAVELQIAPSLHPSLHWTIERMSPSDLDFLRTFSKTCEIEVNSKISILCFHGSPLSSTDVISATTSAEDLERYFEGQTAPLWIGGHTHVQLSRRHGQKLLLNAGSIGNAFKHTFVAGKPPELLPWAEYTILEVDGERVSSDLRRIPFDAQEVLRQMSASGNPSAPWWLDQYK